MWKKLALVVVVVLLRLRNSVCAVGSPVELNPAIAVLGAYDLEPYQLVPPFTSRCTDMVDRSLSRAGGTRLAWIPTIYWMSSLPDKSDVIGYCFMINTDGKPMCKPMDEVLIQKLASGLELCMQLASDQGVNELAIVPHLDESSRSSAAWRNSIVFDPLARLGNFTYEEVLLNPIADAVGAVAKPWTIIHFALQGEMSATVMRYPNAYAELLPRVRQRIIAAAAAKGVLLPPKQVKIGLSWNFNKIILGGLQLPRVVQAQGQANLPGELLIALPSNTSAEAPQNTTAAPLPPPPSAPLPSLPLPSPPLPTLDTTPTPLPDPANQTLSPLSAVPEPSIPTPSPADPLLAAPLPSPLPSTAPSPTTAGDRVGRPLKRSMVLVNNVSFPTEPTLVAASSTLPLGRRRLFQLPAATGPVSRITVERPPVSVAIPGDTALPIEIVDTDGLSIPRAEPTKTGLIHTESLPISQIPRPPPEGLLNVTAVRALLELCDFHGISAYASLTADFKVQELQNSAFTFAADFLSTTSIDIAAIMKERNIPFHYSEFGMGGGLSSDGTKPADSATQAALHPFFGTYPAVYKAALDPWLNPPVRQFMIQFWAKAILWLSQGGGPTYPVSHCFVWTLGSYDILAIYPESTNLATNGSYFQPQVSEAIKAYNNFTATVNREAMLAG